MIDGVSLSAFLLLVAVVAIGGAIQGVIGFGYALIAVPVLALVRPASVPVTSLFLALPMTVGMAVRERAHIDVRGFSWIVAGRVVGTAAGVWVLVAVPADGLSVLLGSLIVLAAALSAVGLPIGPGPATNVTAGVVSGVMGTTSSIGGPALAVVYHRRPGPELRSTLALSFVVGLLLSIGALLLAGEVHPWHLGLAVALMPALLFGLWASTRVARYLDRTWLRPAVLLYAGAAGTFIVVRALLGG